MRPALLASRVFCVLPVLSSRWGRHARTIVLLLPILAMTFMACLRMFKLGVSLSTSAMVVFYGTASMALLLFSRLAKHWPELADRWRRCPPPTSASLLATNDARDAARDVRGPRITTITMLVIALVEHLLSALTNLIPLLKCGELGGWLSIFKSYFITKFPHIFEVLPFSIPLSLGLLYLNLVCTFLWNFIDILIVVFSTILAKRFQRLNDFLDKAKGKDFSVYWWQEVREAYNSLAILTKHLDAKLSPLVLLSFASNLYFICLQLLYNMTGESRDGNWISTMYFYFSFAWLLLRAALVSMSASNVYEQSVYPVDILYCVPSKSFCTEVQRFLVQTTTDTVALSGCRFFWVTRSLVLTLAGTVATYEIVLVQFSAGANATVDVEQPCYT